MTGPESPLSLILLTTDPTLSQKLERDLTKGSVPATLTVVRDVTSLQRATGKRTFDGLIVETRRRPLPDFAKVQQLVDPSRTFLLVGSRETLLQTVRVIQTVGNASGPSAPAAPSNGSLEDYFESKLGDFVKEMKHSSARDLHPMLLKTVERPLIGHALKVSNGNQIKAALLLGMNRNTLRKKITELRIPVNREKVPRA